RWAHVSSLLGQPVFNAFANNGDVVYNAVDNLVGDGDLIAVRTRATSTRPFERLDVIRRAAEQRYHAEEKRLQDELAGLESRLEQLQPTTPGAEPPALNRAQQDEVAKFQQQKVETRR